jgi:hypothetical protein
MEDLTEFQQRAMALAVVKMLKGKHFSVSDMREIAKTIGREQALGGRDFSALSALHCVDWADMGPDLARLTREKCLELLGLPAQTHGHACAGEARRAAKRASEAPAAGVLACCIT